MQTIDNRYGQCYSKKLWALGEYRSERKCKGILSLPLPLPHPLPSFPPLPPPPAIYLLLIIIQTPLIVFKHSNGIEYDLSLLPLAPGIRNANLFLFLLLFLFVEWTCHTTPLTDYKLSKSSRKSWRSFQQQNR